MLSRQISLQNPPNSFTPILLRTLCRRQNSQVLWNQANPTSFSKTPGVGLPRDHFASSASVLPFLCFQEHTNPSPSARPRHPLFSYDYELLALARRFTSTLFSWTYKLLFSQLLSFHIYTNCRGGIPPADQGSKWEFKTNALQRRKPRREDTITSELKLRPKETIRGDFIRRPLSWCGLRAGRCLFLAR